MKRNSCHHRRISVALLTTLASAATLATENFDMRYAPGIGGSDMSAPVEPGLYLQVPAYHYSGTTTVDSSPAAPASALPPTVSATTAVATRIHVQVDALLPRLTYMSTTQFLGATVGYTALLPIVQKKSSVDNTVGATSVNPSALQGLVGPTVNQDTLSQATSAADAATGSHFGVGDLEVGVMLRWQKDDNQIILIPNVILPTGQFNKTDAINGIPSPGTGNFYTFRPSLQFSHIGNGWDFGVRASFSMNTKNEDTDYRSGNYVNVDWALMKDLPQQFRVGLEGYVIQQTTNDTYSGTGNNPAQQTTLLAGKGHAYAAGPALSWIKGSGELLVEGKWLKEFSVANRPDGSAVWLSVAKPFL